MHFFKTDLYQRFLKEDSYRSYFLCTFIAIFKQEENNKSWNNWIIQPRLWNIVSSVYFIQSLRKLAKRNVHTIFLFCFSNLKFLVFLIFNVPYCFKVRTLSTSANYSSCISFAIWKISNLQRGIFSWSVNKVLDSEFLFKATITQKRLCVAFSSFY